MSQSMLCPSCKTCAHSYVSDTRHTNTFTRRRRNCSECGYSFTTYETTGKPFKEAGEDTIILNPKHILALRTLAEAVVDNDLGSNSNRRPQPPAYPIWTPLGQIKPTTGPERPATENAAKVSTPG